MIWLLALLQLAHGTPAPATAEPTVDEDTPSVQIDTPSESSPPETLEGSGQNNPSLTFFTTRSNDEASVTWTAHTGD